uniref:Putative product n=1 Tax=Xenopsylla cheopis TaxID=163159 RepID=A0A6M2DWI3_XENCH
MLIQSKLLSSECAFRIFVVILSILLKLIPNSNCNRDLLNFCATLETIFGIYLYMDLLGGRKLCIFRL